MAYSIPQKVFDTYVDIMDNVFIGKVGEKGKSLGIDAVVHYPSLKEVCGNCTFNTLPGVGASNIYNGGPYPFSQGEFCPYCNGLGYKQIETTETIRLRAYFDKKSWSKIRVPIGIKDGSVWTIGKMSDLIKIQRAAYIILPSEINSPLSYTLFQEPIPWGMKRDRYFSAFWQRGE